jgi:hypothetical protein
MRHPAGVEIEVSEAVCKQLVGDRYAEVVEEPSPAPERNKVARKLVHTKG